MADSSTPHLITASPVFRSDRLPLVRRTRYDFSDYGFVINNSINDNFEVVPTIIDDLQSFIFFFSKEDISKGHYSLFNLHAFLKYSGPLEDFAHSRGLSVASIPLLPLQAFGVNALTYNREIIMSNLFKGAEQVVDFIGGTANLLVADSHIYFEHRHNHYYSGMIHIPGDEQRYDRLRISLFSAIELV